MNRLFKLTIIGIAVATAIPVSIGAEHIESRQISSQQVNEKKSKTEAEGREDGADAAKVLAGQHANDHFNSNLSFSTDRDRLTEREIVEKYELDDYSDNYKKGFLSVFNSTYSSEYRLVYTELLGDSGRAKGRLEAEKVAKRDAEEHFHTNLPADPSRSMMTDAQIIARYYLNFRDRDYRIAFLESFKEIYVRAYIDEYIEFGESSQTDQYERAKEDGTRLGALMGISHAMIDFSKGERNDWEASFDRMNGIQSVESRYSLDKEDSEYARVFSRWFKSAFGSNYRDRYRELNVEVATENLEYREITGMGDVIRLEVDNILGSIEGDSATTSKLASISLEIPPGAFYKRTYVGISRHKNTFGLSTDGYEPVTDVHSVSVSNQSGDVSLKEDLTLEFEYVGTDRVGIYQYINGRWTYLPTEQTENRVVTKIPKGIDYSGGDYALFIDNDYSHFKDIQASWAREEIYSYLRRGHIIGYGDDTFRPDNNLTRLEFLIISSRVLGWDYEGSSPNKTFQDANSFGDYHELINYASRRGYIMGYEDGYFRPNRNISYREIEYLMSRITGDSNFSWTRFADKIKHERFKYSNSYKNINNHINRAETVYMYYELEKKGEV